MLQRVKEQIVVKRRLDFHLFHHSGVLIKAISILTVTFDFQTFFRIRLELTIFLGAQPTP